MRYDLSIWGPGYGVSAPELTRRMYMVVKVTTAIDSHIIDGSTATIVDEFVMKISVKMKLQTRRF
jgi:hypothetical protein